ncbi:trypsin-like peptidase domain-containing protein [Nocardiopsis lambiniae]|uniref:Trypsin-like peptidase domain-containing protein n=1 Tax=Nocardiopsis lambiniae TaxID=3075539 RepID=A0ABU2MG83_9ACTN|nr:trypsin-like peptidase domain-containing protein [Nocardiopsis sp. DSM 44743]MDT0331712.1 trypsin-like peptidase domain-containing protein [Nocardiopsis sp. DSM 44743]
MHPDPSFPGTNPPTGRQPSADPGAPTGHSAPGGPFGPHVPTGHGNLGDPTVHGGSTGRSASAGPGDPTGQAGRASAGGLGGHAAPTGQQNTFGSGGPAGPNDPVGHPGRPAYAAPTGRQPLGAPGDPAAPMPPAGPGDPGVGGFGGTSAHTSAGAAPRRNERGIPAWMALTGMLVVALIAGGAGGLAGGLIAGSSAQEAVPEPQGPTMNEPPPEAPQRDPDTIAGVAQRVSPSVVSIRSADRRVLGGGSGFVIDGNYVVTNDHVSTELEQDGILVEYSDGSLSEATVVGADPSSDLSVLTLADPIDVEPLQFGDSEQVIVGDEVIAIGAPLGYSGTVTQGIISAVNRPVSSGDGPEASRFYALQTDAAINPGNSGGPLVDTQGRVIGVNSMIVTMGYAGETAGNIGLGFAIPSLEVERVVQRLIENGEATYADIGAEIDIDSPVAGAVIAEGPGAVERGGAAEGAGLRSGDVIIVFDGRPVNSGQELLAMLRDRSPGDEVEIDYERDGERETTTMTLDSTD